MTGGYSTTTEYITLLKAYTEETDCYVWRDIILNLRKLLALFEKTNVYDEFKSFVINLLTPIAEKIGPVKSDNDGEFVIQA